MRVQWEQVTQLRRRARRSFVSFSSCSCRFVPRSLENGPASCPARSSGARYRMHAGYTYRTLFSRHCQTSCPDLYERSQTLHRLSREWERRAPHQRRRRGGRADSEQTGKSQAASERGPGDLKQMLDTEMLLKCSHPRAAVALGVHSESRCWRLSGADWDQPD